MNGNGGVASRRQATRTAAKLSPIQGTPTKPERTPQLAAKRDRSAKESTNPARQQKFAASPLGRNAWNAKKQSQAPVSGKAGSKERGSTSPSKIPLKTNRVGSSNSLNPSRFITISDHPSRNKKAVDKGSKEVGAGNERGSGIQEDGCDECGASEKASSPDLHLIDLLKQTSTATGTSSVVSTTATTAVQPLHIDANAILLDKDGLEKKNLSKQQNNSLSNKSCSINASNDDPPAKQNSQNSQLVGEDHRVVGQTNPPVSIKSTHKSNGSNRTKGGAEGGRNDSPIPSDAVNDRSRSNGTVTKSATDSAPQRSNNKIQSPMIVNDPNTKSCRPGQQQDNNKTEESVAIPGVSNEVESSKDSTRNSSSTERGSAVVSTVSSGSVEEGRTISSNNSGRRVAGIAKSTSVSDRSSISSKANNSVSASNEARKKVKGGKEEGRSLKSAGGVSVDSIESARSTDTGVSVDTVRGVSSPREKTGMHVVKRPQEIETLSGNVVHLEQNGEPA